MACQKAASWSNESPFLLKITFTIKTIEPKSTTRSATSRRQHLRNAVGGTVLQTQFGHHATRVATSSFTSSQHVHVNARDATELAQRRLLVMQVTNSTSDHREHVPDSGAIGYAALHLATPAIISTSIECCFNYPPN